MDCRKGPGEAGKGGRMHRQTSKRNEERFREPMGNGFGGAREKAAATAAEYAPAPKPSIKRAGR